MRISKISLLAAVFCTFFFNAHVLFAQGALQGKTSDDAKAESQGDQSKKQPLRQNPAIDKVKIESHVRRLNMWGPQIQIRVGTPRPSTIPGLLELDIHADAGHGIRLDDKWYLSEDGQVLLRADLIQVKNDLFQANLDKLNAGNQPWFGDPNGLVKIVVFSDFQCPFCRTEALTLREKIPTAYPKGVRVLFADFPLEELHPWSKPAAVIGRCVYRQDPKKFWDYHDWAFRQQSELTLENLTSKFKSFAGTNLDIAQIEQCLKDEKIVKEVDDSVAMGRALRIATLPTVFVNGRSLQNPSWEQLEGVIDYELEYIKKAQEACNCGLPNGPAKKN